MRFIQVSLTQFVLGTAMTLAPLLAQAGENLPIITVYKSASCGCCGGWVKHLEEHGFKTMTHDVEDLSHYKRKADLPRGMGSCHTAFVDGYAVEGHVPASDIEKMLTEKPDIRGIAVPGMPMGSPGMEYGDRRDAYQTIGYTIDGQTSLFASH